MQFTGRSLIANSFLLLICILICVVSLEVALRFLDYKVPSNFAVESRYYFKSDNESGYDIEPGRPPVRMHIEGTYYHDVWSNELGCFDTAYQGEQDYILLLGDSFAHMFAPFENKFGTVIQTMLGRRVLKCGVVGYGTRQQYLKAKKIIAQVPTSPRLIVVGYFINDLYEDYAFPSTTVQDGFLVQLNYIPDLKNGFVVEKSSVERKHLINHYEEKTQRARSLPGDLWNWWDNSSAIHAAIKKFSRGSDASPAENMLPAATPDPSLVLSAAHYFGIAILPEETYPWIKKAWDKHFEAIFDLKRLADSLGAELLFVLIPTKQEVYVPEMCKSLGVDLDLPHNKIRDFLEQEQIACFDLLPLLKEFSRGDVEKILHPEKDLYWHYDAHLNALGNELAGLLIAEFILRNTMIDVSDRDRRLALIGERLAEFD